MKYCVIYFTLILSSCQSSRKGHWISSEKERMWKNIHSLYLEKGIKVYKADVLAGCAVEIIEFNFDNLKEAQNPENMDKLVNLISNCKY